MQILVSVILTYKSVKNNKHVFSTLEIEHT